MTNTKAGEQRKVTRLLINRTNLSEPILRILNGRYGEYTKISGYNRSIKYAESLGYKQESLTALSIIRLTKKCTKLLALRNEQYRIAKLAERANQVEKCLLSSPIEINQKQGELCLTADLGNTPMIEAYSGCGKGTAYINEEGKLIAFHYGYERPANAPKNGSVKVELSCTQVCFFNGINVVIEGGSNE